MWFCLGIVYSLADEETARPGISFTPEFNLILTNKHYVVPFVISLDDIYAPLHKAKNLTSRIIHNINHSKKDNVMTQLVKTHINEFQVKFQDLYYSLNDYLTHILGHNLNELDHTREKRGAVNFIGSIANTLFGTATQSQIDYIHERLTSLNTLTEKERQVLNLHSETLNVTLNDLTNVHTALDKLEKASEMTGQMMNTMYLDIRQNEQALITLETLMYVQLALSTIASDHVKLRIGLQTMLETFISPEIISNNLLLTLLKDVSAKSTGLLFPSTPEFLGLHKAAIRVLFKQTALTGLTFYLLIPLRGNPVDTYNVFRMASLPYPIPKTDSFIMHQPAHKYLVISESRTLYFFTNDFQMCRKHDSLLMCPSTGPVYSSSMQTCELALYLKKESASSLCKKFIVKKFPPIFIKNKYGWTYSTSAPLDITLNCVNDDITKKMRYSLIGTGNLEVGSRCSVHSNTLSLPEYSTVIDPEVMKITPYPFSTPLILSPWEHDFIVNATNISLPSSDDFKPVPLQDYIDRLQPLMEPLSLPGPRFPEWLRILMPIGITFLLLAMMAGGRLLHSRWFKLQSPGLAQPHDAASTLLPPPPACPHHHGARGRAHEEGSLS